MHADDPSTVALGHNFHDSAQVARNDRSRHMLEAQDAAFAVHALLQRLRLGEPSGSDRRVGEGDARQRSVIQALAGTIEGVFDDKTAVLGGDVNELRVTGDVTGRPHPWVTGRQIRIDEHFALRADSHADLLESEPARPWTPTGSHEHVLGSKLALSDAEDNFIAVPANRIRCQSFVDFDPFGCEGVADRFADFRLFAASQLRAHKHRDVTAKVREQLRLLHGHVSAADDQQRGGELFELHRRRRRQVPGFRQSRHVGNVGFGARGNEIVARLNASSVHVQGRAFDEASVSFEQLEAVLVSQLDVLALTQVTDDLVFRGNQLRHVHGPGIGGDSGKAGMQGTVPCLGAGQQRFGRNAADVDARPADGSALDHDHAQIPASGGDRGRESAAT